MKRASLLIDLAAGAGMCLVAVFAGCKSAPGTPGTASAPTTSSAPASTGAAALGATGLPDAGVPAADRYKVTASTTGFFRYSPLQAAGSDLDLKKDSRLTMMQRGHGYSQVKTPDGQVGYVGTEDIGPLTPQDLAAENAAAMETALATQKRSSAIEGEYTIPPEAGNNERLPEPDSQTKPGAKATPNPMFHY